MSPALGVEAGVKIGAPTGAFWEKGQSAIYSVAPEVMPSITWNQGLRQYRSSVYGAARFVSQAWVLDAGARPLDLLIALPVMGQSIGVGAFFAGDLGIRTNFDDLDFYVRPVIGLSMDELITVEARYSYAFTHSVHGVETSIAFDVLRWAKMFFPSNHDEFEQ